MKRLCTNCRYELDISEFSEKKTVPGELYKWCDTCRKTNLPRLKTSYITEMRVLKEKAMELHKFTPEQDQIIKQRYLSGEKPKDLAAEFKVAKCTIYNAIKRSK